MKASGPATLQELIAWVERSLEDRLGALDLAPPLRAWRIPGALLVHGRARAAGGEAAPARGVRLFAPAPGGGVWLEIEERSEPRDRSARLSPPTGTIWLLEARRRRGWTLPEPQRWPPLSSFLAWPLRPAGGSAPPLLPGWSVRLEAAPPSPRRLDGLLFGAGEESGLGPYLAALAAEELRELRRGETDRCWWIHASRGLGEEFPRRGRDLRNLGTSVEPVLVPADRSPHPPLGPRQIRELLGAEEGQGVLWWDGPEGEECALFRRSDLEILTDASVAARRW